MKRLTSTLLLMLVLSAGSASAEERAARPDESRLSNTLSSAPPANAAAPESGPGASMLDLSLFGVITLGVLGLFWIRRHTSEL